MNEIATHAEFVINPARALEEAFLNTDSHFLSTTTSNSGCCAVVATIKGSRLVVANAGDSRAILCRAGRADALTEDHRPSRQSERDRIEHSVGGSVEC
jgi:protein phosphatase 1L